MEEKECERKGRRIRVMKKKMMDCLLILAFLQTSNSPLCSVRRQSFLVLIFTTWIHESTVEVED
jgi:hypothetical protein